MLWLPQKGLNSSILIIKTVYYKTFPHESQSRQISRIISGMVRRRTTHGMSSIWIILVVAVVRRPYERIKRPLRTVCESLTSKLLNHFLLSLQCSEPSHGPELKRGVNVFEKFKRCEHFLAPGSSVLLTSCPICLAAGQAEAELKDFSPYFKGQYSAARFAQVEEDLEPNKEKITQLLKQKVRDPTLFRCPSSPARPVLSCPNSTLYHWRWWSDVSL